MGSMAKIPRDIVEAFRVEADRDVESIAVLLVDDGFEVGIMRVLASWPKLDHGWRKPKRPCPDDGKPTAAAWSWLVSGLELDYDAIASAAGVSRSVAREKVAVLLGNRLCLPDGTISKMASRSLQEHARVALGLKVPKVERPKPVDDKTN